MHILRRYVEQIEGLTGFVFEAASTAITQGVALDINPIWLYAYGIYQAGLGPSWFFRGPWPELESVWRFVDSLIATQAYDNEAIDFTWIDKSGWVQELTYRLSGERERPIPESSLPFLVKVVTRPVTSQEFETRERLRFLTTRQNFFTILETRPLGALAVSPGDGCIAGGNPGTLGGFLRDRNAGLIYAATCGHVARAGVNVATAAGVNLGVCTHSHAPQVLPAGQHCKPGCANSNVLDLALVQLNGIHYANTATGIATQIVPHQPISLNGAASGQNTFEVGALMMTYCPGASNTCFENMFEVRPHVAGGLINPRIRAALTSLPTQGDSGGWLQTTSKEWCGILVAADHWMGYALEADESIIQADKAFGTQLQLI